ncbi:g4897 [Coccomyxa viridis]|uniref:G4897 protein n=1 Tax=Coccomyxa viridis TaxID=1274662 RepID=A0ABP1FY98_9CHLO
MAADIPSWEELADLASKICTQEDAIDAEDYNAPERAVLVAVGSTQLSRHQQQYSLVQSLEELAGLAETAKVKVVGLLQQHLDPPDGNTYLGSGKIGELVAKVEALAADTVIVDSELTPRQLRNLSRQLGDSIRLCDRTALILDIFKTRALSREGQLQVEYASMEYQLPRLIKMWTHLERQAGGKSRGMGEKQIEVDRRLLRSRIAQLRDKLDEVREDRAQHRVNRAKTSVPVLALVGYTNAGKSCLMNQLTLADVLSEDALFATLDTTVRKLLLPSGLQAVISDTVGFIQKLPPKLVAAFQATLDDINSATLILHVVDCSHPLAAAQSDAVVKVLEEIGAAHIPVLTVWNKIDLVPSRPLLESIAEGRDSVVCVSAQTGEGIPDLLSAIEERIKKNMVLMHALIPFRRGELLADLRGSGIIEMEKHCSEAFTSITA